MTPYPCDVAGAGCVSRTTRAIRTSDAGSGGVGADRSRFSFDDHQRNVLAAYPSRLLNVSARSPLARHASTRWIHASVVVLTSAIHHSVRQLTLGYQTALVQRIL
jgi:hypothetical protein